MQDGFEKCIRKTVDEFAFKIFLGAQARRAVAYGWWDASVDLE